jgi:hypothetical protein
MDQRKKLCQPFIQLETMIWKETRGQQPTNLDGAAANKMSNCSRKSQK